jgi:hypothetical protein
MISIEAYLHNSGSFSVQSWQSDSYLILVSYTILSHQCQLLYGSHFCLNSSLVLHHLGEALSQHGSFSPLVNSQSSQIPVGRDKYSSEININSPTHRCQKSNKLWWQSHQGDLSSLRLLDFRISRCEGGSAPSPAPKEDIKVIPACIANKLYYLYKPLQHALRVSCRFQNECHNGEQTGNWLS